MAPASLSMPCPTGLAMSSAGAVTGTPTVVDEVVASSVTHRGVSSAAFTWTVVGNQTVAPSYSDREVTVDVPVSVNLAVGWQNADPSGFTIDALPTGLSMNIKGSSLHPDGAQRDCRVQRRQQWRYVQCVYVGCSWQACGSADIHQQAGDC